MKLYEVMMLALAACLIATAIAITARADTFTVTITRPNLLTELPNICVDLRATLPPERRSPWDSDICMGELAMVGARQIYAESEGRQNRAAYDAARTVSRQALATPSPEPTPDP